MPEGTAQRRPHHRVRDTARAFVRKPAARLGLALVLTTPVLAAGVSATSTDNTAEQVLESASSSTNGAAALMDLSEFATRADRASRSAVRTMRPVTLDPKPVDHRWTTTSLNVWTGPGKDAKKVGLIKPRTKIAVTGQRARGRLEVLRGKKQLVRWVTAGYLADSKPKVKRSSSPSSSSSSSSASTSSGLSGAPCPDGSGIEGGLTSSADRVYRAVCNAFPQLTSYGGYDPHGEHVDGRAIDFMTDKATGDAIAQYLLANAGTLGLRDIIWYGRIWTAQRSSEGWRAYGDYGSPTANHMDHVHVAVN